MDIFPDFHPHGVTFGAFDAVSLGEASLRKKPLTPVVIIGGDLLRPGSRGENQATHTYVLLKVWAMTSDEQDEINSRRMVYTCACFI